MADAFNLSQLGNLPPELYEQQQNLNRQQQMAQLLMQQGQQTPQGQMVSGRYVAPSIFQNLASLAQTGLGTYLQNKGDKQALEIAKQLRQGRLGTQQALMEAINAGDTKKALSIATADQYGAGKEFIPALIGSVIPKSSEKVSDYNFAQTPEGGNFKGTFNEYVNQITPAKQAELDLKRQELGLQSAKFAFDKEQAGSGGKLTETQGNATAFGMRAKEANQIATGLEKQGVTDTGLLRATVAGAVGGTPFIGKNLENTANTLLNFTASDEQQATKQARQNFVTAVLRKESGAAISPEEFRVEEEKYFPKINDSAKVIEQKQKARELAIKSLEIQAGPGAKFIRESGQAPAGGAKKVVNFNDLP